MKKIPTLFERVFENNRIIGITDKVHDGMEWVLNGEGIATIKYDGACCAVLCGVFYKRYDAKNGKNPTEGAIPCCPPDPITGHHPHWIRIDSNNPSDKWFVSAFKNTISKYSGVLPYGTYEAIGKHFNGNPYKLNDDMLIRHGDALVTVERSFEGIKKYLENNEVEGLVFWKEGEPQCKIKRSDFGFAWGKSNDH